MLRAPCRHLLFLLRVLLLLFPLLVVDFFFVGSFFRLVLAMSCSSFSLMDLTMLLEAPLREDLLRLPRLADNAAPAAICCFLDFAGMI